VVRSWRFPAPAGGGSVAVTYPFFFRSAGNGAEASAARDAQAPTIPPAAGQTRAAPRRPGTAPLPGDPLGRRRGPGRWVRARRIWVQQAELRRLRGASARDLRLVALRRKELAKEPLSRDRHRRLYAVLARSGQGAEALSVLEAWLGKDPRSREALELLAEAAARLGQRQRAIRAHGSLLELDPANAALHRRMVAMHLAAGDTRRACAHRLSLGSLVPQHSRTLAEARACREGFAPRPASRTVRGRVSLRARWRGGQDLDLALVTPRGRRISWLANRRRLSFAHVTDAGREELAVSWLPAGRYRVELAAADGSAALPASGVLRVRAPGLDRRLRFTLTRSRAYVAELRIRSHSRLVPAR
jgi:tetratricopeptide (TPR) repeat protein